MTPTRYSAVVKLQVRPGSVGSTAKADTARLFRSPAMPSQRTTLLTSCAYCGTACVGVFCTLACQVWDKIDASGDCWQWTGRDDRKGYGDLSVKIDGKWRNCKAHRIVWTLLCGPIPDGLQIDHLCRNRLCVNPDHLEPVTPFVNVHRSYSPSALRARQTACKYGHSNWYLLPTGNRACASCHRPGGNNASKVVCKYGHSNWRPRNTGGRACVECARIWSHEREIRRTAERRRLAEVAG